MSTTNDDDHEDAYRLSPKALRYVQLSDKCDANVISRKEARELRLLEIELQINRQGA